MTEPRSPAHTAYPSQREAGLTLAVLFVVALLSQLDRQLPALLVSPLRAEFGLTDTAFSVLQGYAFALAFTLAGLPLGRLVDRGHRRNLLLAGLLFWSAATALFAFGDSYEALLLARVGVGLGEAVLAPAAFSLIADLAPPHRRGRMVAWYSVSLAIGTGASLLLGGWLLALIPAQGLHVPGIGTMAAWRVAFLVAAAPAIPVAVLLAFVREPARQPEAGMPRSPAAPSLLAHLRQQPATFARLLAYPTVLALVGYGALAWAPALFERSHGMPAARSGVILGLGVAGAGAAGMLLGGWLSDRWLDRGRSAARLRVALLGMAMCTPPAMLWPVAASPVLAFGLLFTMVLGISLAQSAVPTALMAVFPNRLRGRAIGLGMLLTGLVGIGGGPTLVALVTDHVFRDDAALGYALACTTGPATLFGCWLLVTALEPYERIHAALNPPVAPVAPVVSGPPATTIVP